MCVSSGKQRGNDIANVLEKLSSETQDLQKDLDSIYPRYEETTSGVQSEKAGLEKYTWN
jgi:hypothetical protein